MTPKLLRQVEELFHAARECRPEDRAELLAGTDPVVRREVESLLSQSGNPLDRPLVAQLVALQGDSTGTRISVGTRLGPYAVEGILGAGGMAVVYRALDTRLGREVAVKVSTDRFSERFEREARAVAALNHPHICALYDVGEFEGRQYIVTELVDGGTLKDWAEVRKRAWREIVDLLVEVGDGLATAHEAGILHRDIKPANMLVARNGQAKLADFGIAKVAWSPEGDATAKPAEGDTRPGAIIGSIGYMSPEQASGQRLDPRSDIFSFGVVLYEVLAGYRPFSGSSDLALLNAIVQGTPPPLGDDVPLGLKAVIEKALQKDPAERYQSARDMVVDLRRLLHQPLETASQAHLPGKWIAASLMILVTVVGTWKLWPHKSNQQQIHSLVVLPMLDLSAKPEEAFAAGMTEALTTSLGQVSALTVIAPASAMRYYDTRKSNSEIARELNVDGLVASSMQRSGDRVLIAARLIEGSSNRQLWSNSYTRDVRDILALENDVTQAIAGEIQAKLTPQERERLSSSRPVNPEAQRALFEAEYWIRKGDIPKWFEFAKLATEKDPNSAPAWALLGSAYFPLINLGIIPAKEGHPKWREAVTTAVHLDENSADAHNALGGFLLFHDWNWSEAEREFEKAVRLNPNDSYSYLGYSDCLQARGLLGTALEKSRRTVRLDPLSVVGHWTLMLNLYYLRRYDEAIEEGRKTLGLETNWTRSFMALAYEGKGDYRQAISLISRPPDLSADDSVIPYATAALAHIYATAGMKEAALQQLAKLTEMSRRRFVQSYFFAVAYVGLGDYDQAFKSLDKGYDERPSDMINAKVDPNLDPLRSDPRYHQLLLRMGLPD